MSIKWEALRDQANDEFKKKNWQGALSLYSDAISNYIITIEMNPHQDSLYSNRGLVYLNLKNHRNAINDLNKALNLNPRNIKALKRLSHIKTQMGELAEAEIYLKRCLEFEPDNNANVEDLQAIRDLIKSYEELKKAKFTLDYKKSEVLAEKLLKHVDTTELKLIYIDSLLQNCKVDVAIRFLKEKLNQQEKKMDDFEYLLSLAYYYDGK
jgi:tetratricopeptide (TPR) repeat protein